jgi:uncharacterized membrane protein YfcA
MELKIVLVLAIIGLFVGLAKTAIGGFGLLAVTLCVSILPARESTGIMLILLLIGDLFAIRMYRNFVDWKMMRFLIIPVAIGIVIGGFFLFRASDSSLKEFIGWIVVALVLIFVVSKKITNKLSHLSESTSTMLGLFLGMLSGFMSAVANAGGTPMSIYFFLRKNEKMIFLGNSAWFFFIVNLTKVPIIVVLSLLSIESLKYLIPAIPFIFLGAYLGRRIIQKIDQNLFQNVTLFFSLLVGIRLIFS